MNNYSKLPRELQIQLIENSCRKNWTITEITEIKKRIEETRIGHRPKKGTNLSPFTGKSIDIVAKITENLKEQFKKYRKLLIHKTPRLFKEWILEKFL
ncbi:MAG: hypothetical protein K5798_03930 [Nitrosopumilus sp.]|uniref:hypothetical protein n=1 Tax=Nitrosopumilus sp. TaxID=2024843 RepID=UPI00243122F9|nr:hypothetical protein [Nitrosopumilus sp.]MCV0366402.1 hypothetical protein [Nitrosopumilus sp.]